MLFNASFELDALSVQINIIINTAEIEKTKQPKVVLLESLFGNEWDGVFSPHIKTGGRRSHWTDTTGQCFIRSLSHMEDDGLKLFSLIASLLFMLVNLLIPLIWPLYLFF